MLSGGRFAGGLAITGIDGAAEDDPFAGADPFAGGGAFGGGGGYDEGGRGAGRDAACT